MNHRIISRVGALTLALAVGTFGLVTAAGAGTSSAAPSKAAKGDPIVFGFVVAIDTTTISLPEMKATTEAAVAEINANGGVGKDHRPLKAVFCDYKGTTDGAAACARQFAEDKTIIADVGSNIVPGGSYYPVISEAGLASLAPQPAGAAEFTTKTSFPISGGTYVSFMAQAQAALDRKYKKPAAVVIDLPQAAVTVAAVTKVWGAAGVSIIAQAPLSITAADVTPAVTKVLDAKPDFVQLILANPQLTQSVAAVYQQSGGTMPVDTSLSQFDQATIDQLGPAAKNLFGAQIFPPPSAKGVPAIQAFNKTVDKYAKGTKKTDLTVNSWASVQMLKYVLDHISTYDRPTILNYLNALTKYETGGLTPTLNFTKPVTVTGLPFTRLFNPTAATVQVKNGVVVPLSQKNGGLVDMSAQLSAP